MPTPNPLDEFRKLRHNLSARPTILSSPTETKLCPQLAARKSDRIANPFFGTLNVHLPKELPCDRFSLGQIGTQFRSGFPVLSVYAMRS